MKTYSITCLCGCTTKFECDPRYIANVTCGYCNAEIMVSFYTPDTPQVIGWDVDKTLAVKVVADD